MFCMANICKFQKVNGGGKSTVLCFYVLKDQSQTAPATEQSRRTVYSSIDEAFSLQAGNKNNIRVLVRNV